VVSVLTLGLIEGVLSATAGILFLVGAANENAPLHKIFGPLVTVTVGFGAYGVHASGAVSAASDVVGLAFFAFIAFFLPVGVMQIGHKMMKAAERPAEPKPAVATGRYIAEQPVQRRAA
jgi:hypothetical protein